MCPESEAFNRRVFLQDAACIASGLAIGVSVPAIAGTDFLVADTQWRALAAFLTGKYDLPTNLTARGRGALRAAVPDFEIRIAALWHHIDAYRIRDVEALRKSTIEANSDLMATALTIIIAFYLGHAGSAPNSRFVSYEEALMYRPTGDVTVTPTYSHGPPGYWATSPTA